MTILLKHNKLLRIEILASLRLAELEIEKITFCFENMTSLGNHAESSVFKEGIELKLTVDRVISLIRSPLDSGDKS